MDYENFTMVLTWVLVNPRPAKALNYMKSILYGFLLDKKKSSWCQPAHVVKPIWSHYFSTTTIAQG